MTCPLRAAGAQLAFLLLLLLPALACGDEPVTPAAGIATTLPAATASSSTEPARSALAQNDRTLGIDVIEGADADYDAAFAIARDAGAGQVSLTVFWDELESAPGRHTPDPNWLAIANLYYPASGVDVALTISVLDTTAWRLPPDLAGRPYDDPAVIARFNATLDYVATQLPDLTLSSLSIGNESDIFLGADAAAWGQYERFFAATAAHARTLWPGLPVGTKMSFEGLTGAPRPFIQSINGHADIALLTYYPLEGNFTVRPPSTVHADLAAMVAAFPAHPIHLLEAGYPSGAANGSSEAQQAAFVRELFAAWDTHHKRIPVLNITWLTDLSPAAVDGLTDYYGLDAPGFVSYLATLGLRHHDATPKPALDQLQTETTARQWRANR